MSNNKLINKYKELRNKIMLTSRKKQFINKMNNNYCLDLLNNNIGVYKDFINENIKVVVSSCLKRFITCKTGNLDEAYISLINKIGDKRVTDITLEEELINILNDVYKTVIEYFGYGDLENRIQHYIKNSNVTLESLKGKNLAVCLEDAILSQNMLKLLGFDSILKVSLVQYENNNYDTHAYNLIKFQNKNYIFDSRFPSPSGPVVSILTEQEYLSFIGSQEQEVKINNTDNGVIYFSSNTPLKEVERKK